MSDLMNTQEVAAYLRIKERKIYDLVRQAAIPAPASAANGFSPGRRSTSG